MKLSLLLGLAFTITPVWAQKVVPNVVPLSVTARAPQMATVETFITGLKEPRGLALEDLGPNSNILIADYQTGEILRCSRKGIRSPQPLATGLKGPTMMIKTATDLFVSESKANRVLRFESTDLGFVFPPSPWGEGVDGPVGITFRSSTPHPLQPKRWDGRDEWSTLPAEVMVVSPATGTISHFLLSAEPPQHWQPLYTTPTPLAQRHNYQNLVFDGSVLFVTDELTGQVLMVSPSGRISLFTAGVTKPSDITLGLDHELYVANEGDGGQLIRLNAQGEKTVVAEKLGRPCAILFLDLKTVLVSNREGNVWKVTLP